MKNPFGWLSPARTPSPASPPEQKAHSLQTLFAISGTGNAQWSSNDYATMARRGYMQNPVAHRCARLLAQNVASLDLLAYEGAQEVDEHPILLLLAQPSADTGGNAFMEALVGHLMVSGNAYLEAVEIGTEPRELHLLRPDRVSVCLDRNGWRTGYDYKTGTSTRHISVDDRGTATVLHLKLFHPLDDTYGMPPLQSAMIALDVHHAASTWNKSLLDNSARPSGAIVYSTPQGDNMSDDQFDRLKRELEEGYSGPTRAGRPLLLEGGLDWKAMGYSPRDMDFVEARNAAARDIALAFGVPPMLLGIPGDNTYSNYQEANRAFVRQTLLPLANLIVDGLNGWLAPRFGNDLRIAINEDRIEGLAAERERVWKRTSAADFLTDAEKREALGYSPEPGDRS